MAPSAVRCHTRPVDWFRGRTEAQQRLQERRLEHPVRSALTLSLLWFVGMWAVALRSTNPRGVVPLAMGSLLFGFGLIWWMRRQRRRSD